LVTDAPIESPVVDPFKNYMTDAVTNNLTCFPQTVQYLQTKKLEFLEFEHQKKLKTQAYMLLPGNHQYSCNYCGYFPCKSYKICKLYEKYQSDGLDNSDECDSDNYKERLAWSEMTVFERYNEDHIKQLD